MAAIILGSVVWRVVKRRRLASTSTQKLSQQAQGPAFPRNHLQELNSENSPELPPAYAKETPVHAQQYEMTNRPGGPESLHDEDTPELWEQSTCDNYTSPEVRSRSSATPGASAEQENYQEWSHETEMPYLATEQTGCTSGLILSPETTGTHSMN